MTRFVPVCMAIAVVAFGGGGAHADATMTTLPMGTLSYDKLYVSDGNGGFVQPDANTDQARDAFNLAHCTCSQAQPGPNFDFQYHLTLDQTSGTGRPGEIWVGTACDMDVTRPTQCRHISAQDIGDIDSLTATGGHIVEMSLYDVINGSPMQATMPCDQREGDALIYLLVDLDGNATYDYYLTQQAGAVPGTTSATTSNIDTLPPPLPTDFHGDPIENGIKLSWTPSLDRPTDVAYYQALCANTDDSKAFTSGITPRYQTSFSLCDVPNPDDVTLTPIATTDTGVDAGVITTVPTWAQNLDTNYLCGEVLDATATSLTITGLDNGTPYQVALAVIDLHGNVVGAYFGTTITPQPVTDFWEDLHGKGSQTQGGFCLLAETYGNDSALTQLLRSFRDDTLGSSAVGRWLTRAYYGSFARLGAYVHGSIALRIVAGIVLAPVVVFAIAWHFLTLPGLLGLFGLAWAYRRRKRSLRLGLRLAPVGAAIAFAFVLAPGQAHADGIQPYWDADDAAASDEPQLEPPGKVTWLVGVKVGPYTPQIDAQLGGPSPGPYQDMFGGAQVMPVLEVDRILWSGFGQVGAGFSVGYMQKTAAPYLIGGDPMDPNRPRASGDTNTFRLLPMAATALYRYTKLDEDYGIPIVPYVRAGFSYYLWEVKTDGHLANVCKDGSMTVGCELNKAEGGTFGLQASLGIAVRAERIDAAAAMSMRNGGIEHAGFYAEVSLAKVDGFGSATKLAVGDTTWFAGVNFEF